MKQAIALALLASLPHLHAGTLTVRDDLFAGTPDILAYNLAHFFPGGNTHDWWRYAGVNGARAFISPNEIEPTDDISGTGDGVTDQASFLARRTALRNAPLNTTFINWPYFENRYENHTLGTSTSGNRIRINFAFAKLRELDISILAQITASESTLPIADANDWPGKWELWQHYYAQAFHLARHFDVQRYQMFNEPDHPNANGLTTANWLMRLQLASDAIQSAIADVNTLYGKSLTPLIYAPVTAGGGSYPAWGGFAVANRHTDFLGVTDPGYLVMHRYDYHQYNSSPSGFASSLNTLRSSIAADMAPEAAFPMSISEFNVHTNSTFQTIPETLDDPEKSTRLASITINLVKNFEKELYCFKFGQTNDSGSTYGVAKNGMHYVANSTAPYDTGGATMAAEVWRLINKGLAPGGTQLLYDRDPDGSLDGLDLRVTRQPATGTYHILSSNYTNGSATMTVDTSAWNLPAGTPFMLEDVSAPRPGGVRTWGTVSADGTLFDGTDNLLGQPANSVWLFTISSETHRAGEIITATEDATVTDGINAGNISPSSNLLVRNDPVTADNRSASFIKFKLPVIHPPDIQLAVLSLRGRMSTSGASIQIHAYGLDDDSWSADTLTWNSAPNLRQSAPAGTTIADRVITGQGDTAHIQGQIIATSTSYQPEMIDVTRFLQGQPDSRASFLLSQDPRWDVALPALTPGDPQVDGIEFRSIENATAGTPAPQLLIVRLPDTDEDGISDHAESNTFLTDPAQPDSDYDGQSDGVEILAGSDPKDPTSRFEVSLIERLPNGSAHLEWKSAAHRAYTILRSTTLEPNDWTKIESLTGSGTLMSIDDPGASSLPKAFYRIEVR